MQNGIFTKAVIDIGALRHNFELIKKTVAPSSVACVVKADAYGHGSVTCTKVLRDAGADFFAVANLNEALEIEESAAGADILLLGPSDPEVINDVAAHGFIQTVHSLEYAKVISEKLVNNKLRAHIKIDTGMNRLGLRIEDISDIFEIINLDNIEVGGIFSHFAMSDEPFSDMSTEQLARFKKACEEIKTAYPDRHFICHTANSAALLSYGASRMDMVRAGIVLYGMNPSDAISANGFEPVMSFISRVTHVHDMKAGETVSYGGIYRAEKDTRIATVAAGYADGFSRRYGGARVFISGHGYAPVVGNICMDQFMCDVSDLDDVRPGDEVVLFGKENRADTLARAAGSINYESLCSVAKRVPRIYIEKEKKEQQYPITLENIATLRKGDPKDLGVDVGGVADYLKKVGRDSLHSVLVIKHGKIAAEHYCAPYNADTPHQLNSISKSFTATAMMFAKAEGLIDYDDKICSFFPDKKVHETNKKVTIRHLLQMCWGHRENIDPCLSAPDPVEACLMSGIDFEPGTHFIYETTASYLLSAIISKVSGMTMNEYLTPRLFEPLGIHCHPWRSVPDGEINCGGYGLFLTTRDIARFGLFLLHRGMGLLPAEIVEEATSLQIIGTGTPEPVPEGLIDGYGYQFWIDATNGVFRADGAFGQFCIVLPKHDAVIAITAGNKDNAAILLPAMQYIYPALDDALISGTDFSKAAKKLKDAEKKAAIDLPSGKQSDGSSSSFSGKYEIGKNELETSFIDLSFFDIDSLGLSSATFDFENSKIVLSGEKDDIEIDFTFDTWVINSVQYEGKKYRIAACGVWTDDGIFNLRLVYTDHAYVDDILIGFDDDSVTVEGTRSVGFGPENYRLNGKKIG